MKNHQKFEDWLPLYVSGQLSADEKREMALHLEECPECRADLLLWEGTARQIESTSGALKAPQIAVGKALKHAHDRQTFLMLLRRTYDLLKFQAPLVRRDLWPASGLMMFIGMWVSILAKTQRLLYFLAPLIASAMLAAIYGPENDDASELTYATATSPWKILLARLGLVSAYNLGLGLAATLGVSLFLDKGLYWPLVVSWLAPMTFLSLLALFLSIWIGTDKAIIAAYSLWLLQYIPISLSSLWQQFPRIVQAQAWFSQFWQNSGLLFALSALLLLAAFLSSQRMPLKSLNSIA